MNTATKTLREAARRGGNDRAHRVPTRGLSLIELMVGIVVALLVSLAATRGAMVFMASQRQAVGVGGAVVGASTALTAIRDDVAAAGLGFFGDASFLCQRLNLSVGTSVVIDGAAFTPLAIAAEGRGDRIDVVNATEVTSGTNVLLDAPAGAASAALRSLLPVTVGQAVLLAPATPGDPCVVRTVTDSVPATASQSQVIGYAAVDSARFNLGAFTTQPTYPDRGRVTLLGDLRWSRYRLEGNDLVLERPLGGPSAVLARDVVALRAEYGLADAGATALANWQPPSGAFATLTAAQLPRVRALRIGLVTRSPQREKPDAAGQCSATVALPTLFGTTITPDVSDWRCYRHRSAVVVVPLRNLVLGTAS